MHIVRFSTFSLMVALLAGVVGCSETLSPEEAADDARSAAADARVAVTDADARVTAADARVRVADALVDAANADARVAALANVAANARGGASGPSAVIPSGTPLKVWLIDPLDSGTSHIGEHFLASLSESVVVNGVAVLVAGTTVRGRVVEVGAAGRDLDLAMLTLELTDVVSGARTIPIPTEALTVNSETMPGHDAESRGAGSRTDAVLATGRDDDVHLAPETPLTFSLSALVSM